MSSNHPRQMEWLDFEMSSLRCFRRLICWLWDLWCRKLRFCDCWWLAAVSCHNDLLRLQFSHKSLTYKSSTAWQADQSSAPATPRICSACWQVHHWFPSESAGPHLRFLLVYLDFRISYSALLDIDSAPSAYNSLHWNICNSNYPLKMNFEVYYHMF